MFNLHVLVTNELEFAQSVRQLSRTERDWNDDVCMIGRVTIDGDEFAPRAKSGFDRSRRLGKLGWCERLYSARRDHGKLVECGVEVLEHLLEQL